MRETGGRATPTGRWEGCSGATRGGHEHRERGSQIDAEKQVHEKRATVFYKQRKRRQKAVGIMERQTDENCNGPEPAFNAEVAQLKPD